ncbi:conserved hypothetical protein [Vibrio chagasii]|nr:conserved hypothetical protein [Vibrio chagasii]
MNKLNWKTIFLTVVAMLTGCGGEGTVDSGVVDNQQSLNNGTTLYYTQDKLVETDLVQDTLYIDLSDNMGASNESAAALTNVASLTPKPECDVVSLTSSGFTIDTNSAKVCDYRFTVGEGTIESRSSTNAKGIAQYSSTTDDGFASGTARVLVGNDTEQLPPTHSHTEMGVQIVIDLIYELAKVGSELDTVNYTLDTVTLVDGASNGSSVNHNSSSFEIYFSPGAGFAGVERINYSLLSKDGLDVLAGTVDVAVSSSINGAPIANKYEYEKLVTVGTTTLIDLSSAISDPDDDILQLIDVFGYNSTNIIQAGTTSMFDSSSFTFQTSQPGVHELSYVISDKNGGYSSAGIQIHVQADISLIQSWDDITVIDPYINAPLTFTAPMSSAYADLEGTLYSEVLTGDGVSSPIDEKYVAFTYEEAYQRCVEVGGRLPIARELETLFSEEGNVYMSHHWPISNEFWVADKTAPNQAKIYDLKSNQFSVGFSDDLLVAYPVTCILLNSDSIKNFEIKNFVKGERRGDGSYPVTADIYDPDGELAPYQVVTLSTDKPGYGEFSLTSVTSDNVGNILADYYDYSNQPNIVTGAFYGEAKHAVLDINRFESMLKVKDPNAWNRQRLLHDSTTTENLPVHTSEGLPLLFSQTQHTNVYSDTSFIGSDFIGEMVVVSPNSQLDKGKYSFYIQQVSNEPDGSWGISSSQPGAPNDPRAFSIVINVYSGRVEVFNGYGNSIALFEQDLSGERRVWFESREGVLSIYTVANVISDKPLEPVISIPMEWGAINPNEPYWVGIGAFLSPGGGIKSYVREAIYSSMSR